MSFRKPGAAAIVVDLKNNMRKSDSKIFEVQSIKEYAGKEKNLFLHASSVLVSGKALLFLGHSTSGKSTISRILSEQYPVLADDVVLMIKNQSNQWKVCNGHGMLQGNEEAVQSTNITKVYSLLAVLRLYKSTTNFSIIQPISTIQTCCHLLDAVFEVSTQKAQEDLKIRKKWFSDTAAIAKNHTGWHLHFSKNLDTIRVIEEVFEKKIL
jgi:energy-coupling factor transporter ATP-binding protein EcfA2